MLRTDLLCLSEAIRLDACLQTHLSELRAMFQALRMGSARGFCDLERRCGRILVCGPPHPCAFACGHVHPRGKLCTLLLAGAGILWLLGGGL